MYSLEIKDKDGYQYLLFHDDRLPKSTLAVYACDNRDFVWRIRDKDGVSTGEV